MDDTTPDDLRQLVLADMARHFPGRDAAKTRIFADTSNFYDINAGDVVVLGEGEHRLLMGNNTREGRFGLDDEVKYWVKRATDLVTGERRIVKLAFYETFDATVGGIKFECFRSPGKEARILDLVRDHPNFMHGISLPDTAGNVVRILEIVPGKALPDRVLDLDCDHETYFHDHFPAFFDGFVEATRAMALLHEHKEKHGDVRRDHIFVDSVTGRFRWIDFDYNFMHGENIYSLDVFGLGNTLIFLAGKGDVIVSRLKRDDPEAFERLYWEDISLVWQNRVANLVKVFPYIPDSLSRILDQFSNRATLTYEHAGQMLDDLEAARADLGR
ncbi:hypothetical protein dsat_0309 [Alkalidesulfovibrio alkalitolerans DSM 16529]|uniref:Protein kinase domain-containing protein n=1 Tax=Alkalidesulfovibrio alkalitolerans DSM 16529 TaxID=1121439 RepID=S7UKN6_9BACT|nr:hypothetical protein [Alkalidesulfovibrio alkalitolerans]EPR32868.1 hypothetical protein dsat_0309 [Alkalidesulfovibrio alkalitolerans DSM 16529]